MCKYLIMRALWDHPCLPYRVSAPWPTVSNPTGTVDWVASVDIVETWLEQYVGLHYRDWTWSMWALHNPYYCGVSFSQERNCTIFLLRFGT